MNYLTLTSIPLFMGISGDDLAIIMDKVELIDVDLVPGETFVKSGDVCQGMAILRQGEMTRNRSFDTGTFCNSRKQEIPLSYRISETIEGPIILEPEVLFGLNNQHLNTWTANTSCQLTLISKQDVRQTLMCVPIWRINFINMLSTTLQKSYEEKIPRTIPQTRHLIIDHILRHCSAKGKSINMEITLEQLSHRIGITRNTIASEISRMEEDGLLERSKNNLHIPSIGILRDAQMRR